MTQLSALVAIATILFASETNEQLTNVLRNSVSAVQSAFSQAELDTLRGLMTKDHVTVTTYAQFTDIESQLKLLSDYNFSEYDISDFAAKRLADDAALVSYRATIRGTYKGQEVPSSVLVTEVWIKRNGKWLQATYQETPIE